ncbi:Uncharacterised protein [Moellerella wisconsensis]|nr:Uncharacterised protein [Moellerella wisconsensis]
MNLFDMATMIVLLLNSSITEQFCYLVACYLVAYLVAYLSNNLIANLNKLIIKLIPAQNDLPIFIYR